MAGSYSRVRSKRVEGSHPMERSDILCAAGRFYKDCGCKTSGGWDTRIHPSSRSSREAFLEVLVSDIQILQLVSPGLTSLPWLGDERG